MLSTNIFTEHISSTTIMLDLVVFDMDIPKYGNRIEINPKYGINLIISNKQADTKWEVIKLNIKQFRLFANILRKLVEDIKNEKQLFVLDDSTQKLQIHGLIQYKYTRKIDTTNLTLIPTIHNELPHISISSENSWAIISFDFVSVISNMHIPYLHSLALNLLIYSKLIK